MRRWWDGHVEKMIKGGFIDASPSALGDLRLRFRSGERYTRFTPDSLAKFLSDDIYEDALEQFAADIDEVEFVMDEDGQDIETEYEPETESIFADSATEYDEGGDE